MIRNQISVPALPLARHHLAQQFLHQSTTHGMMDFFLKRTLQTLIWKLNMFLIKFICSRLYVLYPPLPEGRVVLVHVIKTSLVKWAGPVSICILKPCIVAKYCQWVFLFVIRFKYLISASNSDWWMEVSCQTPKILHLRKMTVLQLWSRIHQSQNYCLSGIKIDYNRKNTN